MIFLTSFVVGAATAGVALFMFLEMTGQPSGIGDASSGDLPGVEL